MNHTLKSVMLAPPPPALTRRVVVTGIGIVSPLGCNRRLVWDRLLAGDRALVSLKNEEAFNGVASQVVARVPRSSPSSSPSCTEEDMNEGVFVPVAGSERHSDFIQFAMRAAQDALSDAAWKPETIEDQERTGVSLGGCIAHLGVIVDSVETVRKRSYRRVSPFFVPDILSNMAAGHISIHHNLKGPNHAVSTACATGAHSIGDAFRLVRNGDADVMVAGGSEAAITPLAMAGFSRMSALSTQFNDNPMIASRPFDGRRDGFVIGEGAGVLILESMDHALRRGARIYAEVRGYGLSGDAHHIAAPPSDGAGAARCMKAAMREAGVTADDIDYINAHATSTPLGDAAEVQAIHNVLGNRFPNTAISSTKGAVGHLLGAAGAVEAAFTVLAIAEGRIPPTANLHDIALNNEEYANMNDKIEFDFSNFIRGAASTRPVRCALNNSFGFGGTNASLCFGEFEHINT